MTDRSEARHEGASQQDAQLFPLLIEGETFYALKDAADKRDMSVNDLVSVALLVTKISPDTIIKAARIIGSGGEPHVSSGNEPKG